jgi:putative holliday junction resolvase
MSPPLAQPLPGRVAAIDYGTVRIGIAISDPGRTIASPLESYTRRSRELDARRFQQLAVEEDVTLWVVGLPIHLDGRESQKSAEARRFAQWLGQTTGITVEMFDERFTTTEAEQLLCQAELTSKRRKRRVDMVAAQLILSGYLESHAAGKQPPGPLEDP